MRALVTLVTLATAACSAGFQQSHGMAEANPTSISIALPDSGRAAEARVVRASVDGGWTVTARESGIVVVGPYPTPHDDRAKLTLRANIVSDGAGARVVLSGTVDDEFTEIMAGQLAGPAAATMGRGQPIREATAGRAARWWAELERWAAAIRAAH